jgi:hypothetical protein
MKIKDNTTPSVHKRMSQLCKKMDASRPNLVYRYIQILIKLGHLFMDGGST